MKDELIKALCKEISITSTATNETIETVYFGGGTPSLLTIKDLELIFETLNKKFLLSADAEITLEANPDDINVEKLKQWKQAGINRLSVGIQSFADEELKWMNRAHNAADSLQCIKEIKEAGFDNYSVDLIYGSPLLTNDAWKMNTDIVFENAIPHISCYALTVEPATALSKMIEQHKKVPVDPEKQSEQFMLLLQWMKENGYEHYEISNFAKPGMRSKHNSSYWSGKKYYGFGPSAHSFDGKQIRRWNIANNAKYIQSLKEDKIPSEEEVLTTIQQLNEYIMTSLRTIEGLDIEKVNAEFGNSFAEQIINTAKKYTGNNKLVINDFKLKLTNEGKFFADGIAADLFF